MFANDITIYIMKGCPFCVKAKSFLKEKGLSFSEIEVSPGSEKWREMEKKTGGETLPRVFLNGKFVGGYDELVTLYFAGKLSEGSGANSQPLFDVIIMGGGPAGLSAALYAARKVMKTVLISKNVGGQVADTYDLDNYLGFSQVETADLITKFDEHVEKFGITKLIGRKVISVDLFGKIKTAVLDNGETYHSKALIIASGKRPRPLSVSGEKKFVGKGVAYCSTCDAPLYSGADVAVVGGGNSALEAALDLDKIAKKIYIVSLTPLTGDKILVDKVCASPKTQIFTEYETTAITGESFVEGIEIKSLKNDESKKIDVEGVFIEIGLLPNSDLFIDAISTNRRGEILTDNMCRTGIAGVFACGDVTDIPYKQVVIAAGEGAKAALSAYDYLMGQR